ncbi:MAG: DUF983 domain-containing protein [Bacteroidota bacterium]
MVLKGLKIYSMLTGVCPRCHGESMYAQPHPYKTSKTLRMNDKCSNCGLKYKIEPSFFFGAMYASYGVGVALGVTIFIISNLFLGMDALDTFLVISLVLFTLYPVLARWGRNIWINLFIDYRHPGKQKAKNNA